MSDEKRKPDAGDTVREGVRSIVGILGALKDAIEQEFDDLRGTGERPAGSTPKAAADTADTAGTADAAEPANDPVSDLRDRFDFVPRKEIEALRQEVGRLSARVDTLERERHSAPMAGGTPGAAPPETPESPAERPFRIDSD